MLQGNFFRINQQDKTEGTVDTEISLNVNHPIYKGHFPDQPVVPGVCMMQIIAELTTTAIGKKVAIKKANQAKFLIPIIPQKNPILEVKIKYTIGNEGILNVTGSIHQKMLTFFKFKGILA